MDNYSPDEFFALVVALVLGFNKGGRLLMEIVRIRPYRSRQIARLPFYGAMILSTVTLAFVISQWSAHDVRDSGAYVFFYLVLAAGWMGATLHLLGYLGLFVREDLLERGNAATGWACTGAWLGIAFCFAGANIGEGPGWWVVIYCAGLASGAAALAWILLDAVTRIADRISIERDVACGLRAGGFWTAAGLILGRAVAGDWVSFSRTNGDFVELAWPVVLLTLVAIVLERMLPFFDARHQSARLLQGTIPALVYLLAAIGYLFLLGKP